SWLTRGLPLSTRDTVPAPTPARAATSLMVTTSPVSPDSVAGSVARRGSGSTARRSRYDGCHDLSMEPVPPRCERGPEAIGGVPSGTGAGRPLGDHHRDLARGERLVGGEVAVGGHEALPALGALGPLGRSGGDRPPVVAHLHLGLPGGG